MKIVVTQEVLEKRLQDGLWRCISTEGARWLIPTGRYEVQARHFGRRDWYGIELAHVGSRSNMRYRARLKP